MIWNPEARLFYDDDIGEEVGCLAVLMALLLIIGSCRGWGWLTEVAGLFQRDERTCGWRYILTTPWKSIIMSNLFLRLPEDCWSIVGEFLLADIFSTDDTIKIVFNSNFFTMMFYDDGESILIPGCTSQWWWFYKKIENNSFVFVKVNESAFRLTSENSKVNPKRNYYIYFLYF